MRSKADILLELERAIEVGNRTLTRGLLAELLQLTLESK